MTKIYVVQKGFNDFWQDAYQINNYKLEYYDLKTAEEALDTVRDQFYEWRIVLRIEIVL